MGNKYYRNIKFDICLRILSRNSYFAQMSARDVTISNTAPDQILYTVQCTQMSARDVTISNTVPEQLLSTKSARDIPIRILFRNSYFAKMSARDVTISNIAPEQIMYTDEC